MKMARDNLFYGILFAIQEVEKLSSVTFQLQGVVKGFDTVHKSNKRKTGKSLNSGRVLWLSLLNLS